MSEEKNTLTNEEIVNETEDINEEILSEDNKESNKKEEFHLDPRSGEDRRKIMASYKKSLRKRAFAPLIGGNVGINPIDLMKEEMEEEVNNQTLDIYDLTDRRIAKMEKELKQTTFIARMSFGVAVFALLMLLFLLSSVKLF